MDHVCQSCLAGQGKKKKGPVMIVDPWSMVPSTKKKSCNPLVTNPQTGLGTMHNLGGRQHPLGEI